MIRKFPKRTITDSYETEIKVSLVLLVCLLLSLNFLSAYSLRRARQAQNDGYILSMELTKELIRGHMENNALRKPEITYLSDLAHRAFIDQIIIADTLGNILIAVGNINTAKARNVISTSSPIRTVNGDVAYYLQMSSINREGEKLRSLAIFDSLFRIAGLIAGLILTFFFMKTVLNPYRKMKKEAAELEIDSVDPDNTGDVEYVVRTFHNIIKELKEKEQLLQALYHNSEKRANSLARYNEYILGGISSGVIICDNDGTISRFNPAARKILKIDNIGGKGRHYRDVFGKKGHISGVFDDALHKGKTYSRIEFEMTMANNEKHWIGLSSSLILDNQDTVIGAAVLLTDLTKIKRLQEISDFTEKMAALGEMAAGLAHEFRNSVAAIMGFGKLIKKIIPVDNKAHEIAELIIAETQTSEEMLRRFLSFAKPLDVEPQRISIGRVINDSLQTARESCSIESIETVLEDESGDIEMQADPTLLKKAFNNLFINSYQAMSGPGVLSVHIGVDNENAQVVIRITDNGEGIAEDILPKVFNPFFTTKDKGTGLGLALVKKIITAHYGSIDVESEEGTGTAFTVTIPLRMDLKNQFNKADKTSEVKIR